MKDFDAHLHKGLSEAEAKARLKAEGFNELPSTRKRHLLTIALGVVKEPMFLLLVACGVLYLLLGEPKEAVMLLGFVVVVMGITLYQERKTERALEALRDLSSPRASVIRDGQHKKIPGRNVVRGDLIILQEGDRVPADVVLLSSTHLAADESLLTGESVPVRKLMHDGPVGNLSMARPGGDDTPFLYSGTLIVQGQGIAEVQAIGPATEIGKIGKALQTLEQEETLLQKETARLVRRLAIVGLSLCVLVVLIYGLTRTNWDQGFVNGLRQADWLKGFLAGITLAMAILPEEFPVVLTIFLAMGAWRMSRKNVLARRVPAIETLGAATVLCTDKTGTLTLNKMSVARLYARGAAYDPTQFPNAQLPEAFHELVEYGILACQLNPFDPMEKAIHDVGARLLKETEHLHADWPLVREYPLSKQLLALSNVWKSKSGQDFMIAAKGAPEAIADLCHVTEAQRQAMATQVDAMACDGLRVLGVARALFRKQADLPDRQHDFDFQFIGLLGLADPIRPTVPAAIRECHAAGIRVVMITGDYPGTAQNIARQIGLPADPLITGPDLSVMSDEDLRQRIGKTCIFARVAPEQKLRIVQALKANGEIVAMTGDGVNNAPALKAAHIGIAMGGRGTDVAREASALVLLDDDFSSIEAAIRMGRRTFDNIQKAVAYIFAIHVPIAGMSLLPVLLNWPLVLMPVHILFLELIIDPACSTVFEAEKEEDNVMKRRPRDPNAPLFSARNILRSVLQGLSVLVVVVAVYGVAMYLRRGAVDRAQVEGEARALAYTTLIIANLGLILSNRSRTRTIVETLRTPNAALWWVLGGAIGFLMLALNVPFLRELFKFSPLHIPDLVICLIAGLVSIAGFELFKRFQRSGR